MQKAIPELETCHLLVLGDIMLDVYYWGEVGRISPEAPVPVVKIHKKTRTLGGAGNVALNLIGLGCRTGLIGVRGEDRNGHQLHDLILNKHIQDHLIVDPTHTTTTKTRVIGQSQQLLRLDEEETWRGSEPFIQRLLDEFGRLLSDVQVVILSDYGKGLFSEEMTRRVIALCRQHETPVFIDPKSEDWDKYRGATCITPNFKEFKSVVGSPITSDNDIEIEAEKLIRQFDLTYLLVTRGAQGMSLFGQGLAPLHIPTEAQDVFDVSGAGDTVIATLSVAVASGMPMAEAAHLANLAAGIVVGKVGTQPVTRVELEAALYHKRQGGPRKVCTLPQAQSVMAAWREEGRRIVFTNGCFDLLHTGHIKLLHQAAQEGDKLVVGLNSDASVKRLKGEQRPILSENERAALLTAIESVDLVVVFEEDTPLKLIQGLKPDVLVKGGDYTRETVVGFELVESWGGRVALVPLAEGMSTTKIIESVKSKQGH